MKRIGTKLLSGALLRMLPGLLWALVGTATCGPAAAADGEWSGQLRLRADQRRGADTGPLAEGAHLAPGLVAWRPGSSHRP
jgi:hypothetical protein